MIATSVKVLEISGYPPPYGGWSVRTEHVKKRMDADGHDCVVLNVGETRRIPSAHYDTVENSFVFVRKVWSYARRGYLLHTHANGETPKGMFMALIAQAIGAIAGPGSVLTFHAGPDQTYFPRQKARSWVPVFKLLFGLPKRIICNSDAVKAHIADYGVPASKVVPIQAFSAQYLDVQPVALPAAVERHFGVYPRTVFCYMAMRPEYRPQVLLNGLAELVRTDPDVGVLVCGLDRYGDGPVEAAFSATVDELGLRDRMCVVGGLSHDEFLTAMTRSLLYLRTPVTDGVCSSILEALALGVPVVACDNGTRPAGVVKYPSEDPAALADAVRSVLRAPAVARRGLGAAADVPDTVRDEIELLAAACQSGGRREAVAA